MALPDNFLKSRWRSHESGVEATASGAESSNPGNFFAQIGVARCTLLGTTYRRGKGTQLNKLLSQS